MSPERLDGELARFLDDVWGEPDASAAETAAEAERDALSEA
jgi:hypothetical protein